MTEAAARVMFDNAVRGPAAAARIGESAIGIQEYKGYNGKRGNRETIRSRLMAGLRSVRGLVYVLIVPGMNLPVNPRP